MPKYHPPTQLAAERHLIESCFRCGACRPRCPTFQARGREGDSPRGRLALARRQLNQPIDSWGANRLLTCIDCGRCSRVCPLQIPTYRVMSAAKIDYHQKGISDFPLSRATSWFLRKQWRYRVLWQLIRRGSKLANRLTTSLPLRHPAMLVPGLTRHHWPQIASAPAQRLLKKITQKPPNSKLRVIFFPGCLIEYIYPQIAVETVQLLTHLGVEVIVPKALSCCGLPLRSLGAQADFERIRDYNLQILSTFGTSTIITACPSCGDTLKHHYNCDSKNLGTISPCSHSNFAAKTDNEGRLQLDGKAFKVYDVNEFVWNNFSHKIPKNVLSTPLTYHDPCHLANKLQISTAPRQLLSTISTAFREADNATDCCGSGGLYSISHQAEAARLLEKKVCGLAANGAAVVATGCPGCIQYLREGFARSGRKISVTHTVSLLYQSFKEK